MLAPGSAVCVSWFGVSFMIVSCNGGNISMLEFAQFNVDESEDSARPFNSGIVIRLLEDSQAVFGHSRSILRSSPLLVPVNH
ncbi:hypothetical protein IQ07DRAFT_422129 [Pyrenochaeta sp. DS3sAY3a]|nr:hypothetical protein IQ07DRAFT_422129 [Pyrenochaeta sp. DS3sAY3a]